MKAGLLGDILKNIQKVQLCNKYSQSICSSGGKMKAELLGDIPTASIDWERWNQRTAWIEYLWIFAKICHSRFDLPDLQNQVWIGIPVSQESILSRKKFTLALSDGNATWVFCFWYSQIVPLVVVNTTTHIVYFSPNIICISSSFCRRNVAWPWIQGSVFLGF